MKEKGNEIGYIEIEIKNPRTGVTEIVLKPIAVMNDIFINYTFENPENWEVLRLINNIFYNEYKIIYPKSSLRIIEGAIKVRTQYAHFKAPDKNPKRQDAEIESEDKKDYTEFQINPTAEVAIRSVEYLGFSTSRGANKPSTHLWLLGGDITSLMHSEDIVHYKMIEERINKYHPSESSIVYVNLKKVSSENTKAGELARVLLGLSKEVKDEEVKFIFKNLSKSFNNFKKDKGERDVLTIMEQRELEITDKFNYLIDKFKAEKQRAEEEKQRAEEEKQRAEEEKQRSEKEAYEEKKLAAIKLIKNGVPNELVSESLGLSLSDIEKHLNM